MSSPYPDHIEGVRHPRETYALFGHADAERHLADAWSARRLHHAWLFAGPAGIGKATLAYRFARFILAQPPSVDPGSGAPAGLAVPPDAPASRRVEGQAHPDLLILTRGLATDRKSFAAEIRVDDVRRVGAFLGSTSSAGGWRVVIVDRADELNVNAANALLKVLEEPPQRSVFLMVAERPLRLPATLRSRCRLLPMRPLDGPTVLEALRQSSIAASADDAALVKAAAESGGSVRRAIQLLDRAEEVEAPLARMLQALPALDRGRSMALADLVATGGPESIRSFVAGVLDHAHRQATGSDSQTAGNPARLARWSEVWENVATIARTADIFNLDRRPFVLSTLVMLAAAAR